MSETEKLYTEKDARSDIWLVTGGGRSGKSGYGEALAAEKSAEERGKGAAGRPGVLYIATAVACDEEMAERIARHQADRPAGWLTWERYRGFSDIGREFDTEAFGTILLDCVGNLLMGILFEEAPDADNCTAAQFGLVERLAISEIDALCDYAKKHGKRLVFVTNEVGMGIIPETRYVRYYRDAMGRVNKHAAEAAGNAVLMVAGLPVTLK